MLSRPKESEIQPDVPFNGDAFERKTLGEGLVNLLARVQGPLTIAVTGPYGSGKTHFLSRCRALLEKREVPVVLVNAWESDFASEPLAPLVFELTAGFSKPLEGSGQVIRKIKGLAAMVSAAAVPLAVKLMTAGLLNADDFTEGQLQMLLKSSRKNSFSDTRRQS